MSRAQLGLDYVIHGSVFSHRHPLFPRRHWHPQRPFSAFHHLPSCPTHLFLSHLPPFPIPITPNTFTQSRYICLFLRLALAHMPLATQLISPQIPIMPATITSPPIEKTLKTKEKAINGNSRSKKSRILRRRGRAKDGIHSDDDIEREARSDSDTDDDSSVVSSDSDVESDSDDDNHATRSEVVTPSTTQSPPPLHTSSKAAPLGNGAAGPFVGATDWAQMVADENANGASDLPVIDFADLNGHAISHSVAPEPRSRKPKASKKALQSHNAEPTQPHVASESNEEPRVDNDQPAGAINDTVPSPSRSPSREQRPSFRSKGQTSRQAYQQRLESDPSFVPKVGEFWGHDDRLLEKDLRSLSGWWRGRWQTRGGRGRVFPPRGRGGRGGFFGGRPQPGQGDDTAEATDAPVEQEIPPIERTWTHDGFEEMKKKEERRRAEYQQRVEAERRERSESRQQQGSPHPSNSSQRGFPFRGRGGFAGRGGFVRGGGVVSPRGRPFVLPPGRVWYTMKPEKPFTQQHDQFLYFDPALRPRPGQGPGLRIKLPGSVPQVIRAPPKTHSAKASVAETDAASVGASSERSERVFTVRMPRSDAKGAEAPVPQLVTNEVVNNEESKPTAEDLSLDEVFTVRPHAGPQHVPIEISQTADGDKKPVVVAQHRHTQSFSRSHSRSISFMPDLETQQQLETIVVQPSAASPDVSATIEETVLRNPPATSEEEPPVIEAPQPDSRSGPPALPPIQTSFSPVPQASPPFNGSPYTYPPALPPGIAMSHHGYPYELATGRPVYLHQPTPPPVMYNPRPMMHGHMHHPSNGGIPFVPGHMHHPSSISSPEFIPQSHTPPVNGFYDPSSNVPIFTPARQSSRVEIRAPSDPKGAPTKHQSRPSNLRTSVVEADVSQNDGEQESSYVAQPSELNDDTTDAQPRQVQAEELTQATSPPMMPYNPYAQPYYYPEQYGYNPYLPQPPPMPYEMYPADHHHQRGQSQPILYY